MLLSEKYKNIVLLFCTAALLVSVDLFAASVSGRVIDDETGRPVSGVTVGIDSLFLLTETGPDGRFSFKSEVIPGTYMLHISSGEYGHHTYKIKVKREFYFDIRINQTIYSTDSAYSSYTGPARQTNQKITYNDIQTYPMRGIGDSLHLMQTLPGVGGGYSLATVPIIRGTNPLLTKYYIDGVPVNNPYHYAAGLVPVISAVNEEAVDQAVLYKNSAPVWMGDSAGNVIDIHTKNPEKPGYTGKILLDPAAPLLPTFVVSGVPDPNWSVFAVARRSTTDILLDIKDNEYSFGDYYAKASYTYGRDHRFTLMFTGSYDDFARDENASESGYDVEALTWEWFFNRSFFLETKLSRYAQNREIKNNVDNPGTIIFDPVEYRVFQAINTEFSSFLFKLGYEYTNYSNGAKSNVGLDSFFNEDGLETGAQFDTVEYNIEGNGIALFTDVMFEYDRFWSNAGIRYEYYGVEKTHGTGYNTEIGYNIYDELSVYGKAGRYIAHPDMLYYIGAIEQEGTAGSEEGSSSRQSSLEDTTTDSFAVGSIYRFYRTFSLQSEIFYTRFENMYPGGRVMTVNNDEYRKLAQLHKFAYEDDGYNYGLETYLKGTYNRIYSGWLSYSYQKTVRNTKDNRFTKLLTVTQDVEEIDSEFSQTHIFRALASSRWGKWNPSLIFHAYSSLPYTELKSVTDLGGGFTQTTFGKENAKRYDMHHRLDGKVNYFFNENGRFYAEAWNIYFNSSNNITDMDNNSSDKVTDIPFFLWLGVEICY